jgi:hypothetical protein
LLPLGILLEEDDEEEEYSDDSASEMTLHLPHGSDVLWERSYNDRSPPEEARANTLGLVGLHFTSDT